MDENYWTRHPRIRRGSFIRMTGKDENYWTRQQPSTPLRPSLAAGPRGVQSRRSRSAGRS